MGGEVSEPSHRVKKKKHIYFKKLKKKKKKDGQKQETINYKKAKWGTEKILKTSNCYGILAQLGEHLPYKQRVIGSSPIGPMLQKNMAR